MNQYLEGPSDIWERYGTRFNQLLTFHVWLIKTRKYLTGMYRLKLCHVLHKGTCIPTMKSFPDSVSSKISPVCIVALNLGLKTRKNVKQWYSLQFAYIYITARKYFDTKDKKYFFICILIFVPG